MPKYGESAGTNDIFKPCLQKQLKTKIEHNLCRAKLEKFVNFTSRGMPLYSVGSSTPMPFPLGYRKQLGRSSMAAAVATMWQSSASSEGAITTMLGRHAI